jgi:hypothetical protein
MIHIYICHMRCQVFGSDAFFCAMLNEQLNKSAVTKMHLGGALQSKIDPIAYVRHSLLEISQLKLEMVSENAVAFAMVSSSFSMLNIMKPELATKLGRQIYYYDRRNEKAERLPDDPVESTGEAQSSWRELDIPDIKLRASVSNYQTTQHVCR